jgi:outer membrane protein TolC
MARMKKQIAAGTRRLTRIGCAMALLAMVAIGDSAAAAQTPPDAPADASTAHGWISRPLSMTDALNIALQRNAAILRSKSDVESAHGIVIETRAVAIPKLRATGNYTRSDPGLLEQIPGVSFQLPRDTWTTGLQLVQSIYEGGRVVSALRSARLTREQAMLQYQTVVADTLLATRTAYYDVLVAGQQIVVNEASVNLLTRELEDQRRRYEAGTVPRFNVLRAEVAVANARPPLIRARNAFRIAKNNLANLLGTDLPRDISEDIPLQLTDTLEAEPYDLNLPSAIASALARRTELGALRVAEQLEGENVTVARSGYLPSVQAFAGYNWRNSQFFGDTLDGWNAGAQLSWNIFDGHQTRGRVMQARARQERASVDLQDAARTIELEVRTAYSTFVEAREVLESQEKVQEEAEEALRLAGARAEAGTGTQLDVLNAETSLTQARTTRLQALHAWSVARARLDRAIGHDLGRPDPQ